jgi:predicted component of type VI protein secretion system
MATLILEHAGKRRGGMLNGRMVIGRASGSHVVIDDKSVSRIHAWVGRVGHTYFIADGGSRTGTMVNGRPVEGRRTLRDGDEILIGPARIVFHTDDPLPQGLEPLNADGQASDDEGTVVECKCGAPTWVAWDSRETNTCAQCGRTVAAPDRRRAAHAEARSAAGLPVDAPSAERGPEPRVIVHEAPTSTARTEPSAHDTTCGACQSPIVKGEQTTCCPECGVSFHANCWFENRGCSSYGCKQVGILDPASRAASAASPQAATSPITQEQSSPEPARQVQWSYVLLPVSGLCGLGGMFTFGVPSLVLLIGLIGYDLRRSMRSRGVFAGSVIFSAIAAVAGAGFSTYWWLIVAGGLVRR